MINGIQDLSDRRKEIFSKEVVLGQIRQLSGLIKEVGLFRGKEILIPTKISTKDLIDFLIERGDILPRWIAIIIKEDGVPLQNKNLDKMVMEIDFSIEPEMMMEIIRDFLDFLDLFSLSKNITKIMVDIETQMMEQIGLKKPAFFSPEETSQKETESSGDSPSKSADLS